MLAGKPPHVRLFLSTVSAEFEPQDQSVAYRSRLQAVCSRPNVTVHVQETFIATGIPTLDKLDDYIQSCDAVVHLVGDLTGEAAHPVAVQSLLKRYPDLAEKLPFLADPLKADPVALSYTQWEAYLAILHGKRLIIARPSESAPRGTRVGPDDPQRQAQAAHRQRLEAHCHYLEITFEDANDLAAQAATSALLDLLAQAHPPGAARIPYDKPPPAATFFGRESQRAELVDRLRDRRNTVVVGAAGMGKTALAAVALDLAIGSAPEDLAAGPYPDGIVFLDLYKFQGRAESAWNVLADSVAGAEFQGTDPARARAESACQDRRLLVIFEGAEEADGREGHTTRMELLSVFSSENRWLLLTRDSHQALPHEKIELNDTLSAADSAALLDSLTGGKVVGEVRDRILTLLDGHPLALTWAGSLLSQGDEHPATLARDWEAQPTLGLKDPLGAEHTLNWLFERSVRRLDMTARQALTAAGLLARAPFPDEAIQTALTIPDDESPPGAGLIVHEALRSLTQRGLLRLSAEDGYREFTHVLGYRFARDESAADAGLRERLATWLQAQLQQSLKTVGPSVDVTDLLQHASALLRTDHNQRLWLPLAQYLLYDAHDRLVSLGRSASTRIVLEAVLSWLDDFPAVKAAESYWQREQSVCCNRLGALAVSQGNLPEAQRLFGEALRIAQRLAESDPSNAQWQRDLSVSFNQLGALAVSQGNLPEAQRLFGECHRNLQRLAESDPSNALWQRDLSVSLNRLGDLAVSQGNLPEAQRLFEECHRNLQRLAESDPGNAQWQRDLSVLFNRLGDQAMSQGSLSEAQRLFGEALKIAQRLVELDPGNAPWQRDLSVSFDRLGALAVSQGNLPEAQRLFGEALRIRQRLAESDPGNAEWQRDLSVSFNQLGALAVSQGNLPEAQRLFGEDLKIAQRLAESDPGNAPWQRDLSVSFNKLGALAVSQGNLPEAQRLFGEALRIRQRLAESDPMNAEWQRDLWVSHGRMANVLEHLGSPVALDYWRQALSTLERMVSNSLFVSAEDLPFLERLREKTRST